MFVGYMNLLDKVTSEERVMVESQMNTLRISKENHYFRHGLANSGS